MPKIRPFRALRYDQKKAGPVSRLVAPPYDIISDSEQTQLYKRSPYNVVRIELNKILPSDTKSNNRYTRSKRFFDDWRAKGILASDERDSIYVYAQEYSHNGKRMSQCGFFALMDLAAGGKGATLPHEKTLLAPKMDRLQLMRALRANVSPIFILYDDKAHAVMNLIHRAIKRMKPIASVSDRGVKHMVWRIDDAKPIGEIVRRMGSAATFIADGHHRFEVSKMYRKEVRADKTVSAEERRGADSVLVYFVESDERALTIFPTHRMIKSIAPLTRGEICGKLAPFFRIEKVKSLQAMMKRLDHCKAKHAFGMYMGGGAYYVLIVDDVSVSDRVIKDKPKAWKRLDVAILHRFVFAHVLGISDADENVSFTKDPNEARGAVDSGAFPLAFFLNPTMASQIKAVARLGECMPRKATYFYPKPLSGLVINKH